MKRVPIVALFIAVGAATHAQGLEQKFTLGIATNEVWRGQMMTDGLVLNPMLDFSLATGTHLVARGSIDTQNKGLDEWRFALYQNFDAIALSGRVGIINYSRERWFADTTEVFASASMKWPVAVTFSVYRDVDAVEGTYASASIGGGIPTVGVGGASVGVNWKTWVGYADQDFAAHYYLGTEAGLADLGFRLEADFGLVVGSLSVWAQATTLLNPDFFMTNGDRGAITLGASWGMKF